MAGIEEEPGHSGHSSPPIRERASEREGTRDKKRGRDGIEFFGEPARAVLFVTAPPPPHLSLTSEHRLKQQDRLNFPDSFNC